MKKIIATGITAMFLTLVITNLSAIATNKNIPTITTNDDLPDLEITLSSTERGQYTVTIKNIGNAPAVIPKGKVMVVEVHVYRSSGRLYDECGPLYTGEIPIGYYHEKTLDNLPRTDSECTVKAWVDKNPGALPNGVITESNEDNNYDEIYVQGRSLSKPFISAMLMNLLEKYPLLNYLAQRVLKI